jgi:hypothetical protein
MRQVFSNYDSYLASLTEAQRKALDGYKVGKDGKYYRLVKAKRG